MTKFTRRILLLCCLAALLVCGVVFAACQEDAPPDGEVSVGGQIVFECDNYDEFTRDITLTFTPNGSNVQGVTAKVAFSGENGDTGSENFTLSRDDKGYSLTDKNGKSYALDLAWGCANPLDDYAVCTANLS